MLRAGRWHHLMAESTGAVRIFGGGASPRASALLRRLWSVLEQPPSLEPSGGSVGVPWGGVPHARPCRTFPPHRLARSRLTPPPPVSSHMPPRLAARVRGSKAAAWPRAESSDSSEPLCVARESCEEGHLAPLSATWPCVAPARSQLGDLATKAPQLRRGEPTLTAPTGAGFSGCAGASRYWKGRAGATRPSRDAQGAAGSRGDDAGEASQVRRGGRGRVSRPSCGRRRVP